MTTDSSISEKPPFLEIKRPANQIVRCGHAVTFVGIWMAIGWLFHLDGNSYLLLGVPLVAAFQIFICKRSLVNLWVRDATCFRLNILGILLGFGIAILPTFELSRALASVHWQLHMPEILWLVCCICGAFCSAFSLCQFTKPTWKALWFCLATAGVIGYAIMGGGFLTRVLLHKQSVIFTASQILKGGKSFLLYFPISFILEEVAFRGAIDSHIHQAGDKHSWLSAIFVSALWGLWHLPIVGAKGILQLVTLIILLPCIHIATGTFLSLSWRRSGNLAVPAMVHALIDAVRNMLLK